MDGFPAMDGLLFLLGSAIGSFLNVLIDRLPLGESVIVGRSHCDHCKRVLSWYELVPVVSYVALGGHCRTCHRGLSVQYPIVELVTGFGFLFLGRYVWSNPLMLAGSLAIVTSLLVIFVADLKYFMIPDSMVVTSFLGVLLVRIGQMHSLSDLWPYVLVGSLCSLFLGGLWLLTRGRGMGLGDVKLIFVLGMLTGFPQAVVLFYVAFLTGATVGVILILRGKKTLKSKVPFGPFLIAGTLVAVVWGKEILGWWKGVV